MDTTSQNRRQLLQRRRFAKSRDLREYPIRKGPSTAAAPLVGAGITETLIGVLARHKQTDYDKPGLMFWRYFAGILPLPLFTNQSTTTNALSFMTEKDFTFQMGLQSTAC